MTSQVLGIQLFFLYIRGSDLACPPPRRTYEDQRRYMKAGGSQHQAEEAGPAVASGRARFGEETTREQSDFHFTVEKL